MEDRLYGLFTVRQAQFGELTISHCNADASGEAYQHLQYLPYGEDYIYQRTNSWDVPYTFSGKEKDVETGYSYFGARYYDSDLSVWLSVDPLSDERQGLSPYNYCQWNPVMLIDPTGALDKGYTVDDNGNIEIIPNQKPTDYGGDDYDVLFDKEEYDAGKRDYDATGNKSGLKINNTDILPELSKDKDVLIADYFDAERGWQYKKAKQSTYQSNKKNTISERKEALKLFYFLADKSTKVEWRMHITKSGMIGLGTYQVDDTSPSDNVFGLKPKDIHMMIHSHPNQRTISREESGLGEDINTAKYYDFYYVYMPYLKNLYKIDKNGKVTRSKN